MFAEYFTFASENRLVLLPRDYKFDGTKPMVLSGHGHSNAVPGPYATVPYPGYGWKSYSAYMDAGLPICIIDAGGGKSWNGETAVGHMTDARDWMVQKFKSHPGPPHLFGFSMGGMLASTFAALEGARTLTLSCPALSMSYIHDNNYNTYGTAELEAVHGGLAGYQAALPTRNPINLASSGAYDDLPILLYHSAPSDPVTPLSSLQNFAINSGAEIYQNESLGHNPDAIDPIRIASFIAEH